MYEYFAQLRKLPEPARRKRALLISLAVSLLILAVWGVSIYIRVSEGKFFAKEEEVSREKNAPGIVETFSSFFTGVKDVFKGGETYENSAGTYDSQYLQGR